MTDLRDLYQETILDHNKHPRNFRRPAEASHHAHGHNPLCGDRVDIYLVINDGRVVDAAFEGDGCAISTASASIMTELLQGRALDEVQALFEHFHDLLTSDAAPTSDLGKLEVLAGVRSFPTRVKCATLPWHTLQAALREQADATTE
ncbi:MAG TPA: SUF system NifU family Fe-S cluster assembly protein [Gammaproteobacteria bacterium]|nr:SUF system NifU family Fe-S cluster assembly protein [Gammaproteobacteria bacterium]